MTAKRLSHASAAIFDLDGTLVLSEPAWEEAKRRVMASLGLQVPQRVYDAFVGRSVGDFLDHVLGPDLSTGQRADLADRVSAEADILLPRLRQPVPGAAQSVRRLADAGLRIALCSSAPRRHIHAALEQLGIAALVEVIVSGAELPRGKPDPLPYLETLRLLDLDATAAFAVEDALAGVRSAHAAGLFVIGIGPDAQRPDFAAFCHHRVADFAGFDRLLCFG
jgi:HAD superfamily hydrolase (TIGR01509 family)